MLVEMSLERFLELYIGAFFIFHAINGLVHWFPIPQQSEAFERFVEAILATRFIFPTVKGLQLFTGLLFLMGIWPLLATALLAPIVFVIVGAQISMNFSRGWKIALLTGAPFFALFCCQLSEWTFLLQ